MIKTQAHVSYVQEVVQYVNRMERVLLLAPMTHVLIALPFLPTAFSVQTTKFLFRMDLPLNVRASAGTALSMIIVRCSA